MEQDTGPGLPDDLPIPLEDYPDVVCAIDGLDALMCRPFIGWVAKAAVSEAGLAGHAVMKDALTADPLDDLPAAKLLEFRATLERRTEELYEEQFDSSSDGSIEQFFVWQRQHAIDAVLQLVASDARCGALEATASLLQAVSCSRVQVDPTSRSGVKVDLWQRPVARMRQVADVVIEAATDTDKHWSVLSERLPLALSDTERLWAVQG